MNPAGFEFVMSASERPQTLVLDRAATGISVDNHLFYVNTKGD